MRIQPKNWFRCQRVSVKNKSFWKKKKRLNSKFLKFSTAIKHFQFVIIVKWHKLPCQLCKTEQGIAIQFCLLLSQTQKEFNYEKIRIHTCHTLNYRLSVKVKNSSLKRKKWEVVILVYNKMNIFAVILTVSF